MIQLGSTTERSAYSNVGASDAEKGGTPNYTSTEAATEENVINRLEHQPQKPVNDMAASKATKSEQSSGLGTQFPGFESASLKKDKEENNKSHRVVIRLSLEGLANYSRRVYWTSDMTMEELFQKVSSRFQGQPVHTLLIHMDKEDILVESIEQWEMLRKALLSTGKETVDAEVRLKCV